MSGRLPAGPTATVVIVTRNRQADLREAVRSALAQTASLEVLVVDDGSTDGTAEMVHGEFPAVHLLASDVPRGYIAQRNRGAAAASGDVIVSLDDDARFSAADTVEHTLGEFD